MAAFHPPAENSFIRPYSSHLPCSWLNCSDSPPSQHADPPGSKDQTSLALWDPSLRYLTPCHRLGFQTFLFPHPQTKKTTTDPRWVSCRESQFLSLLSKAHSPCFFTDRSLEPGSSPLPRRDLAQPRGCRACRGQRFAFLPRLGGVKQRCNSVLPVERRQATPGKCIPSPSPATPGCRAWAGGGLEPPAGFAAEGARAASLSRAASPPPQGVLLCAAAAAAALFISRLGAWKRALPTRPLPLGFADPKLKIRFRNVFILLELEKCQSCG